MAMATNQGGVMTDKYAQELEAMKNEQTEHTLLMQHNIKGPISFYDFLVKSMKSFGFSDEEIDTKIHEVVERRVLMKEFD